jgi:hypothetical protein
MGLYIKETQQQKELTLNKEQIQVSSDQGI